MGIFKRKNIKLDYSECLVVEICCSKMLASMLKSDKHKKGNLSEVDKRAESILRGVIKKCNRL